MPTTTTDMATVVDSTLAAAELPLPDLPAPLPQEDNEPLITHKTKSPPKKATASTKPNKKKRKKKTDEGQPTTVSKIKKTSGGRADAKTVAAAAIELHEKMTKEYEEQLANQKTQGTAVDDMVIDEEMVDTKKKKAPIGPPIFMKENQPSPKWLGKYAELKAFKEKHGNLDVPKDDKHKQLTAWIRTQKQQYKQLFDGKPNHMSQVRIDLLTEVGFEWSGEKRDKFWNERYAELEAYHAKNGNCRVTNIENPQLHTWLSLQRRQLRLYKESKPSKLTTERAGKLEAIGLEYQIRNVSTWMDRFMELKRYKERKGDTNVPQKWKENPSLGRWVDNQKTNHKNLYDGKPTHLTIERIQLLVSLGFNFRY